MKKVSLIISTLLILSNILFAQEEPPVTTGSYRYFELGAGPFPIPIPAIAFGYRNQNGHNGFDTDVQFSTIIEYSPLKWGMHYLCYPKPDIAREYYVGAGPAFIALILNIKGSYFGDIKGVMPLLGPEFLLGKQYMTDSGKKRHFQLQVIFPTWLPGADPLFFPIAYFSYGWGF